MERLFVENDDRCLGYQAVPWGAYKALINFKSMLASSGGWMSLSSCTDALGRSEGCVGVGDGNWCRGGCEAMWIPAGSHSTAR